MKTKKCLSYRKFYDGERYDIREFDDREAARIDACERQYEDNKSYRGTPYPYYVTDQFGTEFRASELIEAYDE